MQVFGFGVLIVVDNKGLVADATEVVIGLLLLLFDRERDADVTVDVVTFTVAFVLGCDGNGY